MDAACPREALSFEEKTGNINGLRMNEANVGISRGRLGLDPDKTFEVKIPRIYFDTEIPGINEITGSSHGQF
jgi:hypothetical protein